MKIAHVVCTFPPYRGGMGNSAYHFAQYTAQLKHRVTVLTIDYGQPVKDSNDDQLEILRLKPIFKLGNAGILLSLLWRLPKYDVVHLHYPFYGSAEIVALAKMLWPNRLRLVVHYHMDNQGDGIKGFIFYLARKFFLPLILSLADEITCASLDYVKHSQAGKYFRHHQRKFSQVPFGVNIQKFKPLTTNRDLQDGDNNRMILFVGGLDRQHYFKGVDNLLTAFSLLSDKYPQTKLMIVGQGDLEEHYHQTAQDLKINDRVIFKHNVDNQELVSCYQQADVLVLPSINQSEAFGIVLLEAMACGKPVIASNLPGVRGVFKNGEQGLLIKPNDIDDLKEKLSRIISNDKLAQRLGQSARELVEKNYTWEKAADKLNIIYYRAKNIPKP